jgi:hypothetical protein
VSSVRAGAALAGIGGGFIALAGALEMVTTSYLLGVGIPPDGGLLVGTAGTALVLGTAGVVVGIGIIALAYAALDSPAPDDIGLAIAVLAAGSLMVGFGGLLAGALLGFTGGVMLRRAHRLDVASRQAT